jgi:DNA-directed RNA polymerase subunit alpha
MIEFKRPHMTVEEIDESSARFVVEPLERGFGYTLGNSMRRILLSSLPGAAVTSLRVDGVEHEFTSIEGVREDLTDIILNVKSMVLKLNGEPEATLRLTAQGPKEVTAGDISLPSGVEMLNPDLVLATLNKKAKLEAEFVVEKGRGYTSAERNKKPTDPIGVIPVDSMFSPVRQVSYKVEHTRVGQRTDYDKLLMEVRTNGSVTPSQAVSMASQVLNEHMALFAEQAPEEALESVFVADEGRKEPALNSPIEDLELSVRSYNCLKRQGIDTLQELLDYSELDLMNIRNFGSKSIEEVKHKLAELDLSLKTSK